MKTQCSSSGDIRDRYVAKVNALISDDREDLVGEIIAEYIELTEAGARQDCRSAA
jgi:hypothetical protein